MVEDILPFQIDINHHLIMILPIPPYIGDNHMDHHQPHPHPTVIIQTHTLKVIILPTTPHQHIIILTIINILHLIPIHITVVVVVVVAVAVAVDKLLPIILLLISMIVGNVNVHRIENKYLPYKEEEEKETVVGPVLEAMLQIQHYLQLVLST